MDLTRGGKINANLSVSSGTDVSGNVLFRSSLTVNGPLTATAATFTGAVVFSSGVAVSSATRVYQSSLTNTFYVGKSSVTIIADGYNPVILTWQGGVSNSGNNVYVTFLDGENFYQGFSQTNGLKYNGSPQEGALTFILDSPVPSAGSHTYSLAVKTDAGTATLCIGNSTIVCQWSARILH